MIIFHHLFLYLSFMAFFSIYICISIWESELQKSITIIKVKKIGSTNSRSPFFSEEYGLLTSILPKSITYTNNIPFQVNNSYASISKNIPSEQKWYEEEFVYNNKNW